MENTYQEAPKPAKKSLWRWIVLCIVAVVLAYVVIYIIIPRMYQTSPTSSITQNSTKATVTISSMGFNSANITIHKGTTVTWLNSDSVPHNVTADKDGLISPDLKKGDTYLNTFNYTGSFAYHCSLHPTMKGLITIID